MTALQAGINTPHKLGSFAEYGVKANTQLYKGGCAVINTSGVLEMAASALANGKLVGVVTEPNTALGATDGAVTAIVQRDCVHEFNLASAAIADIGKAVYLSDDNTFTLTSTDMGAIAGYIVNVIHSNKAYIRLVGP